MTDVEKRSTVPPSAVTEPQLTRVPRAAHHGGTPAAWAGSITALVGALVGTVGFFVASVGVIVAGFVIIGVALVVTVALRAMGYGAPAEHK